MGPRPKNENEKRKELIIIHGFALAKMEDAPSSGEKRKRGDGDRTGDYAKVAMTADGSISYKLVVGSYGNKGLKKDMEDVDKEVS